MVRPTCRYLQLRWSGAEGKRGNVRSLVHITNADDDGIPKQSPEQTQTVQLTTELGEFG